MTIEKERERDTNTDNNNNNKYKAIKYQAASGGITTRYREAAA